jgi:hypothetical protein
VLDKRLEIKVKKKKEKLLPKRWNISSLMSVRPSSVCPSALRDPLLTSMNGGNGRQETFFLPCHYFSFVLVQFV